MGEATIFHRKADISNRKACFGQKRGYRPSACLTKWSDHATSWSMAANPHRCDAGACARGFDAIAPEIRKPARVSSLGGAADSVERPRGRSVASSRKIRPKTLAMNFIPNETPEMAFLLPRQFFARSDHAGE